MALRIRVAPAAADQIRSASQWWTEHRPAAPDLLHSELDRAFQLIVNQPGVGAPALDEEYKAVRRVTLRRTRYRLYYQVHDQTIEILALWHSSRGEDPPIAPPA